MDNPANYGLATGVEYLLRDGDKKQWIAPNSGKYPIAHVDSFMNRYTSLSKVYRDADEAIIDSRDNARFMLNDVGIRECLDTRRRMVSLLNWHLEPEDSKSQSQKEFCLELEKVIRRIKRFTEYRYSAQYAIWFGKYGIQHRWRADVVGNKSVWKPTGIHQDDNGWRPLQGDKIVFRQSRPDMVPGAYEGQMGIRVGWMNYQEGDWIANRWRVESTDYGLAYFLSPAERRLMLIHKHHVEDAAFEDGLRAGAINGVGIRSVIYWEWFQAKTTMAFLLEFLERMAGGIQIWKYPQGNKQAYAEAKAAAEAYNSGQEHILLVPVPIGEDGSQYGVEVVEPGFQGIEVLHRLIKDYYNDRIKRYILGQKLSSEAEATGMGSGVAELHMDTLLQIIRSDSIAHEETMTSELSDQIIRINVDKKVWMDPGFRPRFTVETDEADLAKKLEAWTSLMDRKIKFRLPDLYELVGAAMPGPQDAVNPDSDPPAGAASGALPEHPKTDKGQKPGTEKSDEDGGRDDNSSKGVPDEQMMRYEKDLYQKPYRKYPSALGINGLH